jgi:hypothetical protein
MLSSPSNPSASYPKRPREAARAFCSTRRVTTLTRFSVRFSPAHQAVASFAQANSLRDRARSNAHGLQTFPEDHHYRPTGRRTHPLDDVAHLATLAANCDELFVATVVGMIWSTGRQKMSGAVSLAELAGHEPGHPYDLSMFLPWTDGGAIACEYASDRRPTEEE